MVKEIRLNRRKSPEQYIAEVTEIHKGYYTYEHTKYETTEGFIDVTCPEHGVFNIMAGKHRSGQGCKFCGFVKRAKSRTLTQEQFIIGCTAVHGDKYDYSETVYIKDEIPVDVICRKHGKFTLVASKHKCGDGCRDCGIETVAALRRTTLPEFIERSNIAHNYKYTYTNVIMGDNGRCLVNVTCKDHGDFPVSPSNHMRGHGCPDCAGAGYCKTKAGVFYILLVDNITKVGITNRTVSKRLRSISRTSGLDFKVHTEIFSTDGAKIQRIEKATLSWLRSNYNGVEQVFDGFTECFTDVVLEDLLDFVMPISKQ